MRFSWPLLFLLLTGPAWANDCLAPLVLLGNPVDRFAEPEKILELSSREIFTHAVGKVRPGKNPILNKAISDAEKAGVKVILIQSQVLGTDPTMAAFAERMNRNGVFNVNMDLEPILAFGKDIPEELAVHEIRHLNDFLKTVAQWQAEGMSREDALARYREEASGPALNRTLERNAIIDQLRHRYRDTGFNLDDPNLVERVIYPEISALLEKGLALRGSDDGLTAQSVMDKAIWKALMIQRLRYNRLQSQIAGETNSVRRTELEARAGELRTVHVLFDQMFQREALGENYLGIIQGLFNAQLRGQNERLKTIRRNSFFLDRE